MTFAWSNFSKGIAKSLARAAGLRVTYPFEDLADKYGEPPTLKIVHEIWFALLECWLALRKDSRITVVEKLRELKQGNLTIKVRTKFGQMAYLNSCSESPLLDEVVLKCLHAEGSQKMYPPSVIINEGCSLSPVKNDPADLFYIDESQLGTKTDDEEWQDSYEMGYRPEDYDDPKVRADYAAFLTRKGYVL